MQLLYYRIQITSNNTIFEINIKFLNCLDFLVFTLKNINLYNITYRIFIGIKLI